MRSTLCFRGKRAGREPLLAVPVTSTNPPAPRTAATTPPRTPHLAPHHKTPASNRRPPLPPSHPKTQPSGRTLLWIKDGLSGIRFLIDTGVALSLLPPRTVTGEIGQPAFDLVAANGTPIATYGTETRRLALSPQHTFQWHFLVADVDLPILGADFLSSHDLLVDTRRRRLQHQPTRTYLHAEPCSDTVPAISHLQRQSSFSDILQEFPRLLSDSPQPPKKHHGVERVILTTGPPC